MDNNNNKTRKAKCPNGTRRDPKTGECVPIAELEAKKKRRTKKNKEDTVVVTEEVSVIRNPNPSGIELVEDNEILIPAEEKEKEEEKKEGKSVFDNIFSPDLLSSIGLGSKSNNSEKENSKESDNEDDNDNYEDENNDDYDDEEDDEIRLSENEIAKDNEKYEYDFWKKNETNDDIGFLYPTLNDPNFNIKIASKKEFQNQKFDGTIYDDIEAKSKDECESSFEVLPHQQFVRNFMSINTPYNSLLLYHELGTGKTCSAIGITEEMRNYMRQSGIDQKIIVIASPNVQENFKLQLFDPSKLKKQKNDTWALNTCAGNNLLKEINPTGITGIPREKISSMIRTVIKKSYTFMGYEQVALASESDEKRYQKRMKKKDKSLDIEIEENIPEIIDMSPIRISDSKEVRKMKEKLIRRLRSIFDHRLIVVDEVHNMISRTENEKKGSSKILSQIVRYCENTRFLFLSATPMYNSDREIIWLVNTMNMNDKRATIKTKEVFDDKGNFVEEKKDSAGNVISENGKDLLRRKLIGYVSYVRGENPYTFPYRIYPKNFAERENLLSSYIYPTIQLNGKKIEESPLKYVLDNLYVNKIGSYQKHVYDAIISKINTDTEKEALGFQDLLKPLTALNMTYPSEQMDEFVKAPSGVYNGPFQNLFGDEGLSNIMTSERVTKPLGKATVTVVQNYEYTDYCMKKYKRLFHPDNIQPFSTKIHSICKAIENSTGTVIIYSKYLRGGLLPVALALEEMGFSRYCYASHVSSLLKTKQPPLDPLTMKPKEPNSDLHAKYVMITGTQEYSPDNVKDLEMVFHPDNKDGRLVKVVLISQAGSEGIDFKCIRQVHILDPWYNMSRIEQIIGRAVRNKSHCQLPFSQRNVEIYMHGTIDDEKETADMYMYRLAESKAIQVGQITRVLKESAVDCLLNIEQNNFTEENIDTEVELELSTNKKKINFRVGDKSFSSKCDYMESCEITCNPNKKKIETEEDSVTYNISHLRQNFDKISKRIRHLFRDRAFYKRNELIQEIQIGKPYPLPEVYYAIGELLKNKNEILIYKGRPGHLQKNDNLFTFQPNEITDPHSSLYDKIVPLDYKHRDFNVQLPDKYEVPVFPNDREYLGDKILPKPRQVVKKDEPEKAPSAEKAPAPALEKAPAPAPEPVDSANYEKIKNDIKENIKIIGEESDEMKNEFKYYAKHACKILTNDHKISKSTVLYYIAHHYIECLSFSQKRTCFENLFKTDTDFQKPTVTTYTTIEEVLYSYFKDRIVESNGVRGIYIGNETSNDLFIWKQNEWKHSDEYAVDVDKLSSAIKEKFSSLSNILKKVRNEIKKKENSESMIGYIGYVSKINKYNFKTKDLFQKRNALGSLCEQEPKPKNVVRINSILEYLDKPQRYKDDAKESNDIPIKNIRKETLCIIYELLLRKTTHDTGECWFLTIEESLLHSPGILSYDKQKGNWGDKAKSHLEKLKLI